MSNEIGLFRILSNASPRESQMSDLHPFISYKFSMDIIAPFGNALL